MIGGCELVLRNLQQRCMLLCTWLLSRCMHAWSKSCTVALSSVERRTQYDAGQIICRAVKAKICLLDAPLLDKVP